MSAARRLVAAWVLLGPVAVAACSAGSERASTSSHGAVGTLVVLGDSISSGTDESPTYANRLRRRIESKHGPVDFHNLAAPGSSTAALRDQISRIPRSLRGPVVVVITAGGIDMLHACFAILLGNDAAERRDMGGNLDAAYGDLLGRNRFGAGVKVSVFQTNVYDASDGRGDFRSCEGPLRRLPQRDSDPIFGRWNDEIARHASSAGAHVVDLHAAFRRHGIGAASRWYLDDCIHPNERGSYELARVLFDASAAAVDLTAPAEHHASGASR